MTTARLFLAVLHLTLVVWATDAQATFFQSFWFLGDSDPPGNIIVPDPEKRLWKGYEEMCGSLGPYITISAPGNTCVVYADAAKTQEIVRKKFTTFSWICTDPQVLDYEATTGFTHPDHPVCRGAPVVNEEKQSDSPESGCPCEGNPINPASGNKFQVEADYVGAGANPLELKRYYNSGRPTSAASTFGYKWTGTYNRWVYRSGNVAKVYRPDGRALTFNLSGGLWTPDPDIEEVLTEIATGTVHWKLQNTDNTIEHYNAAGKLIELVDANGLVTILSYQLASGQGGDGNPGTLDRVTNAFGRKIEFTYNSLARVTQMKDPAGKSYVYGYASNGNLTTVKYPDEDGPGTNDPVRTYHYENTSYIHALTGVTDENSVRFSTFAYDTSGRAKESKHAGDVDRTVIEYEVNGANTTTVTDPAGQVQTYHFQSQHSVRRATQIDGGQCTSCGLPYQEIAYDSNGFITGVEDFNGNVTTFTRDTDGRGLEKSRTEGQSGSIASPVQETETRTIATSWNETYRLPELITEAGKTTNPTYESGPPLLKNRIEKDSATGETRTTAFIWQNGLLKTVNGPRTDLNDVTTYAYDAAGNVATITNALNRVTTFNSYDAHGRPTQITDANGNITVLIYDARGRLTSRTLASGTGSAATTEYEYDKAGNLTKTLLPGSAVIDYTYDAAHRLRSVKDNLNNLICYDLDEMGNRTKEEFYANATDCTSPGSTPVRRLSREYDAQNRLVKITGGEGQVTTFEYDGNGNRIKMTVDPDGLEQVTEYFYDRLNRLTEIHAPEVEDGVRPTTRFEYDARDNLTKVTDPTVIEGLPEAKLVTEYHYDGLDNLTKQVSPDTRTTLWTYDAAGNRKTQTDARSVLVNYAYDAVNRLISVDYSNNALDVTFAYDACVNGVGQVCSMTDDAGMTTYAYNRRGVVNQQTVTIDAVVKTLSYQYDAADRLTRINYPSGWSVDYVRDLAGYVDQVTMTDGTSTQTLASGVGYLPFGPRSSLAFGNGIQESRGYDLDYRLKTLTSAGTATVQNLGYAYAPTDNIQAITDHLDGSQSQAFGYDALNRLTSASAPQSYGDQLFTYDLNGNRQTALLEGQTTQDEYRYEYEQSTPNPSHRLLEITNDGASVRLFTSDNNGNTKTAGPLAFTYAQSNRVSQVTDGSSTVGTYTYNGRGERVKTVTPAGTTLFYYGPEGQLLAETDGAGVNKREYVYLDGVPLALLAGTTPTIRTVHTDHLGTPQLLTNPQQAVNWSAHYEPFGKATVSGTVTNNLRFPGQYFDAETGMHYNYKRDYSTEIGRYWQSDPIGLFGGQNTYVYSFNNPVLHFDPFGLDPYCTYDIRAGRMYCFDIDTGQVAHESPGWVSGKGGPCQNNPTDSCVQQKNFGPIAPDLYHSSGVPSHRQGTSTTRRNLDPMHPNPLRSDFQTHFCPDPTTCSNGCVAHPDWETVQEFNKMLDKYPLTPINVITQDLD